MITGPPLQYVKPPRGIMPREIYESRCRRERLNTLSECLGRFTDAQHEIPINWINEYNDLVKQCEIDDT